MRVERSQSAVHSAEISQLLLTQQVLLLTALGGAAIKPLPQHVSACERARVSWGGRFGRPRVLDTWGWRHRSALGYVKASC